MLRGVSKSTPLVLLNSHSDSILLISGPCSFLNIEPGRCYGIQVSFVKMANTDQSRGRNTRQPKLGNSRFCHWQPIQSK